jgi:selenocysteine-specific elongation factor
VVEALVASAALAADGPVVRLPGHTARMDPHEQAVRRRVEEALRTAGITVHSGRELAALGADRRLVAALVRLGVLVQLTPELWIGRDALRAAAERLRGRFTERPFAAGEARQALGTNRRAIIPLLEHLDRTGVTLRAGDHRRLRPARDGPDE